MKRTRASRLPTTPEFRAAAGKRCAVCTRTPLGALERHQLGLAGKVVDPHHILARRTLRAMGLEAHMHDPRNALGVCRAHHDRHEDYTRRIPRELLPKGVFAFAAELGIGWLLDREYPPNPKE